MEENNEIGLDALADILGMEVENIPTENDGVDFTDEVNDLVEEKDLALPEDKETKELEDVSQDKNIDEEVKETDSFKAVKFLINTGQMPDLEVEVEDGSTIKLSEFSNLDEDTFKEVMKLSKETDNKDTNKNYVKVSELSELQQKLISIVSKGSEEELKNIFSSPDVLKEPYQGYDSTNEKHNLQVYYDFLTKVKNLDDEEAKTIVEQAQKNLTLDTKAAAIVNFQRDSYKKVLESKEKELADTLLKQKEEEKLFSKNLTETFKKFDLKPEVSLAMVKSATIKGSDSKTAVEGAFSDMMKDPEKAAELVMFLTNKELYDKKVASKTKVEEQTNFIKKVRLASATKTADLSNNEVINERPKSTTDVLSEILQLE